ncbi:MAG: periplasmic heavy metal sensor [Enhydrobacter sp.]|nr:MAG: periplasmic heavy metal sensor [Enhydrobacter sp.]
MSSRWLQILLGLSLLLNAFVLAGFVWRTWIEPPAFAHAPPPGPRPSPLDVLSQELALDERQRVELRDLFERYGKARRERYEAIQGLREQMGAELRKPEFDLEGLDGLVDQMMRLRVEQQKEYLRAFAELKPRLRPDQQERLHRYLSDRYSGRIRPPPPASPPPSR